MISTGIQKPANYIYLPGKTHEDYSYPDLLVSMNRLGLEDKRVKDTAQSLGIEFKASVKENTGKEYATMNFSDALSLNLGLGGFSINLRQLVDLLSLLRSGEALDGNGERIRETRCISIYEEIVGERPPWRSEWTDTSFRLVEDEQGIEYTDHKKYLPFILYDHRLEDGELRPLRSELLKMDHKLGIAFIPGINFDYWLRDASKFGLPSLHERGFEVTKEKPPYFQRSSFEKPPSSEWNDGLSGCLTYDSPYPSDSLPHTVIFGIGSNMSDQPFLNCRNEGDYGDSGRDGRYIGSGIRHIREFQGF